MEDKKKVEAVLFSVGKEVSTERIAELCSLDKEKVGKVMKELKGEYGQRNHSLRINQRGDFWKLTVKDEFIPLVSKLVEGTDLDRALMETLAVIAWKYPVVQSEVIKLRNNKAYDHIKRLMELEFVDKERFGRTYKLKLTKKFFEYFDLPSNEAKSAFLKNVPGRVLKEAEGVDKEADEVERLVSQDKKEKEVRGEIKGAIEEVRKMRVKKKKSAKGEENKVEKISPESSSESEDSSEEEEKIRKGVSLLFG